MSRYNKPPITELAISLPFSITPYGSVSTTTNQYKVWADRARSVIGTSFSERIYRPRFGTGIPQSLFDSTEDMVEEIRRSVQQAFDTFLSTLTLEEVNVEVSNSDLAGVYTYGNVVSTEITYSLPNGSFETIIVGIATIDGNNPIIEEN